ncbi:disulfide bond formation protein B [Roseiarcus sp.]|uniref:disulfide bond formation protein B n=1 Tax=Roseiarcus sp. TaxID=1969460 RepID=UPI003F9484B0
MDVIGLILPPSQVGRALWILAGALATLAAVWTFEAYGFTPCELCLTERYAFYAGAPLAALTAYCASRSLHGLARALFALLALIFLANVALAFYHVGVEQHWWPGPTACTGSLSDSVGVNDLMKSLNSVRVVNCDEVQLRILGLSFAGWDVVASAVAAIYSALAVGLKR